MTKDLISKVSILNGANYFSSAIFQNYLVLIPVKKHVKYFSGTTRIDFCKSNGISEENIENTTKSDSNFATTFADHYLLPDRTFNEHCLKNIFITTNSMVKKFKRRFYIKELLIWVCKAD